MPANKTSRPLLVALALEMSLSSGVGAAESGNQALTNEILGRYVAMKGAMQKHDRAALAAILARDFTSIDITGKTLSGSEMIADIDALPADPNRESNTEILSLVRSGNRAEVRQRYDMTTVRPGTAGDAYTVRLVTLSTDTWEWSGSSWQIEETVTDEISVFQNDKLVAHRTRP